MCGKTNKKQHYSRSTEADQALLNFMVAGPGFGKTQRMQKAIAEWNKRSDCQMAIVHCSALDTVDAVCQKITEQLTPKNNAAAFTAKGIFLNQPHLLDADVEAELITQLVDSLHPGDELHLCTRRMPAVALVRWQSSYDIQLLQEPELMQNTEGQWPLVFEMKKNSWHQGAVDAQVKQYLQTEFLQPLDTKDIELLSQLALFEKIDDELWKQIKLGSGSLFELWQRYRLIVPESSHEDSYRWIPEVRKVILQQYPLDSEAKLKLLARGCDYWLRTGCFQLLIDSLYDDCEQYLKEEKIIVPLVVALIFTRRFHQARFVLEQMKEADGDDQNHIIAVLAETLSLFTTDEGDRADKLLNLERHYSSNDVIRCLAILLAAYQAFYSGNLDEAALQAREALLYMNERQQVYLSSLAEMLLIACDKYRGYTLQAAQQLVLAFNNKKANPADPAWQNYATGMLIFHYEKNDFVEARLLCEQVIPHINNACSTEVIVHFYLYYARILELAGEVEDSFEYLIRLQRFLSLGNYPRYQGKMVAERMRQSVRKKDTKSMRYLQDKFAIDQAESQQESMLLDVRDYLSQARAMQLLHENQYDAVIALLIPLRDELLKNDYQERALVAEAQIVVAYWHKGDKQLAQQKLVEAVNFYGWLLFNRSVLDEAPGLVPVMAAMIEDGQLKPSAVYKKMFQSLFVINDKVVDIFSLKKFESLTAKEQEVMKSLADGLSNQNIAERLDVAPTTVKWHLKNIYRKLALDNRSSAIAFMHKVQPAP